MVKNKVGLLALSSVVCMLSFGSAFANSVKNIEMVNSSVGDSGNYKVSCSNGNVEYFYKERGVWHNTSYNSRISDEYDNKSIDAVARGYVCK